MAAHGIAPIDLVAVNLYPFEATVAQGARGRDCVENIDIGGPALIRAAAKNHDFVAVLTEPAQYDAVLDEIARAWRHHACAAAAAGRRGLCADRRLRRRDRRLVRRAARRAVPARLTIAGTLRQTLRYGENPHQAAAFYVTGDAAAASRPRCRCRARSCPTTT